MKKFILTQLTYPILAFALSVAAQCPEETEVNYLSDNLLFNGSFEDGDTNFETDLDYFGDCQSITDIQTPGEFSLIKGTPADCNNYWTPNLKANDGNAYLISDFPNNEIDQDIWCEKLEIEPDQTYEFSGDFANVLNELYNNADPAFRINVEGNNTNPGVIYQSNLNIALTEGTGWQSISTSFESKSNTVIKICIQNTVNGHNGLDMATDNLSLKIIGCKETDDDNIDDNIENNFFDCDEVVSDKSASLLNGSFEEGSYYIWDSGTVNLDQSQIDAWNRAAYDRNIQITDSGHNGVQAYEGDVYSRVNSISNSSIYQDIATVPGDVLHYSFAHRGGEGVDQIAVYFGTPKSNGQEPLRTELVNTYSTDNNRWILYEGKYEVPIGQFVTRFSLGALSSSNGNLIDGNLIDAVTVQSIQASCEAPMKGNVEICGNGIDDDGDNLIDDADPDCSASGGNDGGLESNGRLADKIFQRTLERRIEPTIAKTDKSDMIRKKKTARYGIFSSNIERSAISIEEFIPIDTIENTETYISSPTDLAAITNASEVFSVDIFRGNSRLAAIFATNTENGVYEHTKYICDRLKGGIINDLKSERIGYADFVVADIIQPEGYREYALSFSAREMKNGLIDIQSHWSLEKYPDDENYYNFQIWASNLENLKKLALKTLQLLNEYKQIQTMTTTAAPSLFVSQGEYSNGKLHLKLINKKASTSFTIEGERASTESSASEPLLEYSNIQGAYSEFVTVEVGSVYDMGFRIKHDNDEIFDDLFIADGLWFIDTKDGNVNYEVAPSTEAAIDDSYNLERSIDVNGSFDNTLNIYRSMKPNFRSVDVSNFNTLHFNVEGAHAMQIVLIKSSITEWDAQYKTSVTTTGASNEINIPFSRFNNGTGEEINANDIQAIIFKIENDGETKEIEINISSLDFRNEVDETAEDIFAEAQLVIAPNPTSDNFSVQWMSTVEGLHTAMLVDIDGKIIREFEGLTSRGFNEIRVERENLPTGMYFFSIIENSGKILNDKIIVID